MLSSFLIFILSIAYMGVLLLLAYVGDQRPKFYTRAPYRATIYSLSLGVYCTSWTFYGAVGTAASGGLAYLPIYIGPILVFLFAMPLLERLVKVAKKHNSTSIADLIATRYGKSQQLAALVAVIALVGILPYIALQLKAVSMGFSMLTTGEIGSDMSTRSILTDTSFYVACFMVAFTILFGTRHLDAREHHHGLLLAIAFESLIKLLAFIAIGVFALYLISPGLPLFSAVNPVNLELTWEMVERTPDWITLGVYTLLSALAIICLPRQFHVMVVENHDSRDLKQARWAFPLYLGILSLFVIPITIAGLRAYPGLTTNPDTFVLALPLISDQNWLAIAVFIGGASAATSMVIMSAVTLSTMISNEIMVPLMLRLGLMERDRRYALRIRLLRLRRIFIALIIAGAYLFSRYTGSTASLAAIGLLSFVAVAQFAPALIGGLLWRRGNRNGAITGMLAGTAVWVYTLLLPGLLRGAGSSPDEVFAGLPAWLHPEHLFGLSDLSPLVHGTIISLSLNLLLYVVVSLTTRQRLNEIIQIASFHEVAERTEAPNDWTGSSTVGELQVIGQRFLGEQRLQEAMESYTQRHGIRLRPQHVAPSNLIQHLEGYLAGVIGSSSARIVLGNALKGQLLAVEEVVSIVDEASEVMRFNRELLQSAIENMQMGVSVIDRDLCIVAWNTRYLDMFNYPRGFVKPGRPLADLLRFNLMQSRTPIEKVDQIIDLRLAMIRAGHSHEYERIKPSGQVILIQGNPMPDGGFVTCFSDITSMRRTQQALKETITYLEQRVRERTEELTILNIQLSRAKSQAEQANQGKTRFLAAASHDLLQPLNAARLLASALANTLHDDATDLRGRKLIEDLDGALESAEDLISTLLDISKLDAGALKAERRHFAVDDVLRSLASEFRVIAEDKGLTLRYVRCSLYVDSDPRLLRRLLQNLLSNAIRYTRKGRILFGARRLGDQVRIEVWDTGPGIPEDKLQSIFEEFRRLDHHADGKQGLGLGLAIVERIARLLDHPVVVRSRLSEGSVFSTLLPVVAPPVTVPATVANADSATTAVGQQGVRLAFDGLQVLCIDNEDSILVAMEALLVGWGCKVAKATTPEQAAAHVKRQTPAIVLADYQLDDNRNGLDTLDQLRAISGQELPGVLITAVNSEDLRRQANARGCQFLAKPVKPAALRAVMNALTRGMRAGG